MLAKKFRLKTKEVAEVLEEGGEKKTKLFIVRVQESEEEVNRFGTVISRRFHKLAVTRNKVKRRIHEAVRVNIEKCSKLGLKIVLIPKKICLNKDYQEIEQDIIYILQNAHKWVKI